MEIFKGIVQAAKSKGGKLLLTKTSHPLKAVICGNEFLETGRVHGAQAQTLTFRLQLVFFPENVIANLGYTYTDYGN